MVGSGTQGLPKETFPGCELLEGRAHVLPLSRPLSSTNFRSGRQDQHPELGVLGGTEKFLLMAARGFLEEAASDLGLTGWAQSPQSSWPLTSVGDNEDDILAEGLGAFQSHLGTDLFHHVQGHLEGGKGETGPAEPISILPVGPGSGRPSTEFLGPLQGSRGSSED